MLKSCGTVDKVDQEECEEEGSGTVENVENKAEESFVGTSPISAHNSVSYNPPKNGLIASALEIPNSVCLSFEHVDPMLQSNSPPCSIKNTIPQDEKHSGLFTNIKNDLSTDHGLEFNKSENQEQCDKLMDLPNGSKQYNEVLIDGFAILSFKTMDDMLEFTKLDESQNPGMNPTIEQTYKRARRCGMPKLKRTKAFLKQTLSQTSTSNDLLRHRRHHHHHHNHSHYHFNNIHQHPALCAYKSHCDTNHMSSTIHLSPNHEKDTKSIVNTTITDGINKLSSIQPNNTSNGNSNKHYHHRSYEVNNSTSLHEETNHNDVHYRDDETPTPPLHHHNPYCFTLNLSTHTIATSNSPIDNTLISSNRSHHHSHNHSSLTTMPKKEHRYSQESIQSPPEYTSMISPKNHSIGNNITSSSSPPPQDYRSMSVPGIWSSRTKPDIISPQKTDKITYGNSCDTDGAKIMPKISVPSENLKRSDSINSSKSHCHQFSVAALTDEVMHSSAQSEESKSQPTIISKSPKHPSGKKRTYRKSEQRDIVNTVSDKYSHRRNEYDKSFAYSKFDNSTRVNRCTGVDNNGSNKSWNSAINDSLKGALYFPTTVGTNHNCERIHETVSKYSPMTNHNFNSTPFSLRNPADSLPAHSYLPPRGLQEPTSCGSQIRPLSSSSAHVAPPSVPSSICSNSFFSHQNLLKQFMGIDSETANQLLNDPRFMELYALTMATLSNNVDGVPDSILPPPVSRISLPNHANTIISTSVNNGNQNNNSCSRFKNGNTVGHLRTTDPSQFGETSLSHCGQQVNLSGIQNKLYPYSNMMMLGTNRPPLAPSTVPQSSQTTSSSSINRLIPPNAESLSISQLQTDRSQAVLAAAYADREFVTSNSTLGKLKLSSQGIMINSGSDRNNNSTVPSSIVSSLQSTTNINCLSDSYNRNAQHFNMPPNPIIQRHHHLSSMPQSSIGTLESSSTLHNSKSNSLSSNLSCSLSSDSMMNKNFGSFPFKLFNGDLHNPVSSSSSSSLSTHNDRNIMMGLHKPEYMPSESVLRPNFPPPLQLIPPPLPPNIPPEFLKSFLVPDSSSSLFPGPKVNVTLNSSFLPSNPNLQSTQPLYSPMRVNHPNRSDKTNYNGILHRPVHGDKLYGRWADAHVRIALFIQHCKSSTQGLQSSPVISSIFSTSRLPIRPMVKRLSLGVHSSMPSSMTSGPVNYNSSKINIESVNNNRSTQPPPLRPPSLLPSQLHNPINSVNSNNNNNNNNNNSNNNSGPSIPSSITSDISFWGHLFNEFMNNLSKEFLNSISDCKDTQLATLQNFYSQMSQMNNSVLNGGSFPKSTDFSFLNSTVSSSSMANNSNNNNCSPVPSASNIAGFNFPLVTQSFNSLSSSSCSSSSSSTTTTSVRPTVLPSSPALMNFSSSTNVFNNNDLKRRRTDSSSSSMDINNLPFPMRFPNSFPRPPTIHNYVPHQHSSLHSGSSIPPPPAHSDMINVAAAASLLNGFRLPETFLNHFPHPIQLSSVSSGSSLNDRKNTRSSNTTTGTITTSSNSSHLIPINPW